MLRVFLWQKFGIAAGVSFLKLPGVLAAGLLNDLAQLVYLLIPVSLYLFIMPRRWFQSRASRWFAGIILYLAIFGLFYLCAAEYFFFEEFDARFNLVAVDYLIYPTEVLVNIWESYPVGRILAGTAVLSAVLFKLFWPLIRQRAALVPGYKKRLKVIACHLLLAGLVAATVTADTLALSSNRVANELSANGITSFFRAFRTNEISYDLNYRMMDSNTAFNMMRQYLAQSGGTLAAKEADSIKRSFSANPAGLGKMNVVVVVEESFGSEFVGALGDKRGLTPCFDRLSKEGLLFTHVYASGTRTVRGLEAITLSIPPIPSESVVKRPGSENMANWGKVMQESGYHASFLYGGYGYFDNMNYFFETNGFAVNDRTNIAQQTFSNIWGVCDEDLFNHALQYFDSVADTKQPFFSLIMSTSNHKPFTFPAGIPGVPEKGGGRDAGIRYADYALGKFIEKARSRSWFDNTLFVIVADHGARVYGKAQIPVKNYEIPLLFYAPGKIQSGRNDVLASQIDIAPTVLGLLGFSYQAPFYGQNILAPGQTNRTVMLNHNYNVAIMRDNQLTVLGLGRKVTGYLYDRASDKQATIAPDQANIDLATAYYQTAFDLFKRHRYE